MQDFFVKAAFFAFLYFISVQYSERFVQKCVLGEKMMGCYKVSFLTLKNSKYNLSFIVP